MTDLLSSEADLAQKKRMTTRRRTALERTDGKLYPARSKRNHTTVAPATAAAETFRRLQRSTSATVRGAAGEGQSVSPVDRRDRAGGEEALGA